MSLLREIQNAATGSEVSISDLLRKCKVLASRLKHEKFKEWVDNELNGYPNKDSLPKYRVKRVHSLGDFSGPWQSGLRGAPIPPLCFPKEHRHLIDTWYCMEPISALESITRAGSSGSDSLRINLPADLIACYGRDIFQDMACLSAWQVIPRGAVIAIADTVRNRVLSFALEIEGESPDAGEVASDIEPLPQEKITHIFNTYIAGDVGNLSAGNEQVTQSLSFTVIEGNFDSLKEQLLKYGVTENDMLELKGAIADDSEAGNTKKIGQQTAGWLGKMLSKAANGTLNITTTIASNVLSKALSQYLGLPS